MKKVILAIILGKFHKLDRSIKKKILIFGGILSVFAFIVVGLFTYTAIQASSYLISKVPNQEQLATLAQNANQQSQNVLGSVVSVGCLNQVKGLLNLNAWLSTPINENTDKILSSCFQVSAQNQNKDSNSNESEKVY